MLSGRSRRAGQEQSPQLQMGKGKKIRLRPGVGEKHPICVSFTCKSFPWPFPSELPSFGELCIWKPATWCLGDVYVCCGSQGVGALFLVLRSLASLFFLMQAVGPCQ